MIQMNVMLRFGAGEVAILFKNLSPNYGTGSCPPGCHGPHRPIRFNPIHEPFISPYFSIASRVYWEQLGVNRQVGGIQAKPR